MDNQNYSHKDGVTSRMRHAAGAAIVAMSLYLAPSSAQAVVRPSQAPMAVKQEFVNGERARLDYKVIEAAMQRGIYAASAWLRSLVPYLHGVGQVYAGAQEVSMESPPGRQVIKTCLADESQADTMSLQDLINDVSQSPVSVGNRPEPGHAYWARREHAVDPAKKVIEFWEKTLSAENPCRLWMLRANQAAAQVKGAQSVSSARYEAGGLSMACVPDSTGGYVISRDDPLRPKKIDREFWSHKERALVPCVDPAQGVASWYKHEFIK